MGNSRIAWEREWTLDEVKKQEKIALKKDEETGEVKEIEIAENDVNLMEISETTLAPAPTTSARSDFRSHYFCAHLKAEGVKSTHFALTRISIPLIRASTMIFPDSGANRIIYEAFTPLDEKELLSYDQGYSFRGSKRGRKP